jgi:hypothetical protein
MLVVFGSSGEAAARCEHCGELVAGVQRLEDPNEEIAYQGWRCGNCGRECSDLPRVDPKAPMPIELVERYLSSLIIA